MSTSRAYYVVILLAAFNQFQIVQVNIAGVGDTILLVVQSNMNIWTILLGRMSRLPSFHLLASVATWPSYGCSKPPKSHTSRTPTRVASYNHLFSSASSSRNFVNKCSILQSLDPSAWAPYWGNSESFLRFSASLVDLPLTQLSIETDTIRKYPGWQCMCIWLPECILNTSTNCFWAKNLLLN